MGVVRANRVAAAASSCILVLTLASACGTARSNTSDVGSSGLEKTNLVVGAVPVEASTPLYLAVERGIFAAHGLHVTIKPIISTSDAVPQLMNGTFDVEVGQLTTYVAAQAEGLGQFRVIAAGLEMGADVDQIVTVNPQVANPGNLAGKVIAENAATGDGELLTDAVLSNYDISPAQVTYKVIPFAKMGAALSAGRVDAAYCAEPYCSEMEQQIGATDIADLDQGTVQGLLLGGYAVTAEWMRKYPHTAAAFAASIDEACGIANTDFAAVQHAFETTLGISAQVANSMATGYFPGSVPTNGLSQLATVMQQYGELSPNANVGALVNTLMAGS
jgi:NitT/TauT family transport system substrate-binding protein